MKMTRYLMGAALGAVVALSAPLPLYAQKVQINGAGATFP
jgi:hypothetical protein